MISGVVNANLDATVLLTVYDINAQPQQVEAVVDTGFDGFLTLPPAVVVSLGVPWVRQELASLANGTRHPFDIYTVGLVWDGRARIVDTVAADPVPLIGTRLMHGYILRIEMIAGGSVTIEVRP
jgi:clan AA aspartic protease